MNNYYLVGKTMLTEFVKNKRIYPSDLKMQSSAGVQIVKYKAFVLRHSPTSVVVPMSNTNNAVVGDLKPARRELGYNTNPSKYLLTQR